MSLFLQNNLSDVFNLSECRNNLFVGDCAFMDRERVQLEGGHIEINKLILRPNNQYQNYPERVYVRGDDNGQLYVDPLNSNIPIWLRTDIKDVDLGVFNNDINATRNDEVKDIVWTSDFLTLNSIPTLSEMFVSELGQDPLALTDNHMTDLHQAVSNTWYIDFELNKYTLCNYNSNAMSFDKAHIGDLYLHYLTDKEGLVLQNGNVVELSNEALNGKADIDTLGMVMLDSNISSSWYTNSKRLSIIESIENKIDFYQSNVNSVISYINSNPKQFVLADNNLSDLDIEKAIDTLSIKNLRDKLDVYDSNIDFLDVKLVFAPGLYDLFVDGLKDVVLEKYPYYRNRSKSYMYICIHGNGRYEVVDMFDFPKSTDTEKGTVKALANLGNASKVADPIATLRYSYIHELNITELSKMRRSLDRLNIHNVLETIYNENTALNTRLLRPSSNLVEMYTHSNMIDTWFQNLDLAIVNKTLDYDDLLRKPIRLGCFENDVGYLSGKSNLFELSGNNNTSLGIGSVGYLDTQSFELEGDTLEMDYLSVMSCLRLDIEEFLEDKVLVGMCHDIDGKLCWCELPEARETDIESKGIVRQHNIMRYDEEGTYTIKVLKDVETEIMNAITSIRSDIEEVYALMT